MTTGMHLEPYCGIRRIEKPDPIGSQSDGGRVGW